MESTSTGMGVVVIVSDPSADAWWRQSLLSRTDLRVYPAKSYETGLELLAKVPCSLLVVEERPQGIVGDFLGEVRRAFEAPRFKVILLCDRVPPGPPVPPVTRILPRPVQLLPFNACLAEILHLHPRKSQRHLVRVQLGLNTEQGAMLGPAATLDMSADGMRVETAIALTLGQPYTWTFSGIAEFAGLKIQGTVLREDTPAGHGLLHCYAVRFDHPDPATREAIAKYLAKEGSTPGSG